VPPRSRLRTILCGCCARVILSATVAQAQTNLLRQNGWDRDLAALVYQHPFFADGTSASTMSGNYEFIGGANLIHNTDLTYSLPIAGFEVEGLDLRTAPANPTIGVRLVDRSWTDRAGWAIFGVTFPLLRYAEIESAELAMITNVQEFHKYSPETWTLSGGYGWVRALGDKKGIIGLALVPKWMYSSNSNYKLNDLLVDYQITTGLRTWDYSLVIELIGSAGITDDVAGTGDRFVNSLSAGGSLQLGLWRPALYYLYPLNSSVRDHLDGTFTVQITYTFSR